MLLSLHWRYKGAESTLDLIRQTNRTRCVSPARLSFHIDASIDGQMDTMGSTSPYSACPLHGQWAGLLIGSSGSSVSVKRGAVLIVKISCRVANESGSWTANVCDSSHLEETSGFNANAVSTRRPHINSSWWNNHHPSIPLPHLPVLFARMPPAPASCIWICLATSPWCSYVQRHSIRLAMNANLGTSEV